MSGTRGTSASADADAASSSAMSDRQYRNNVRTRDRGRVSEDPFASFAVRKDCFRILRAPFGDARRGVSTCSSSRDKTPVGASGIGTPSSINASRNAPSRSTS